MKKVLLVCLIIIVLGASFFYFNNYINSNTLSGIINYIDNETITIENNKKIYTFKNNNINEIVGSKITITCDDKIDKDKEEQTCNITRYKLTEKNNEQEEEKQKDKELFEDYYTLANNKLKTMTTDEKISQILLVRYYESKALTDQEKYQFGGFVFFEKDFKNKTKDEVIKMINDLQAISKIPILTAIDEEGGTVSRLSSNKNLVDTPFLSPQALYSQGGFQAIKDDVTNKSKILEELGLNLNLAPVVDVSTNSKDYIYQRTLGQGTELTSTYAEVVIKESKNSKVSYTLKHFPGYGNNLDTHTSSSIDNKTLEEKEATDIPPFISGIKAGAEAIMVSHNIVSAFDAENPSSISLNMHNYLRNNLKFQGVIITDDISMGALKNISDIEIKAIKAGNDLIITSNYETSFNNIKNGLNNNTVSIEELDALVEKVLAWKYYKHLI